MLKSLIEDYRRHGRSILNPALWTLATYRYGRFMEEMPLPLRFVGSKVYGGLLLGVQATTGNVLYREVKVGQGLTLPHARNVLIHPDVVIGDRVTIEHGVSIVTNRERAGAPKIGNDVVIEAGAKILGPVTIGDGAVIAANSLVTVNVPRGATAIGVPARILPPAPPPATSTDGSFAHLVS